VSTGTAGAIAPHQPVTRLASALDQGRSWRCPARRFLRCAGSRWAAENHGGRSAHRGPTWCHQPSVAGDRSSATTPV